MRDMIASWVAALLPERVIEHAVARACMMVRHGYGPYTRIAVTAAHSHLTVTYYYNGFEMSTQTTDAARAATTEEG